MSGRELLMEQIDEILQKEDVSLWTTQITRAELIMIRNAIRKSVPMEVEEVHVDEYYCPACGTENNCDELVVTDNYCPMCGQALKRKGEALWKDT